MRTHGTVTALVGAQYGSEGKGAIASVIADKYDVHVRTGAPNAGHTYYIDCPHPDECVVDAVDPSEHRRDDRLTHFRCTACNTWFPHIGDTDLWKGRTKVVARSVPVGAKNKNAHLVIGPGGMLDVELICHEVRELDALGLEVSGRIFVDRRALVIDKVRHHDYEGSTRGYAHENIGSTGEGVGIARMAHIARGVLARDFAWSKIEHAGDKAILSKLEENGIAVIADASHLVNAWIDEGSNVLLEGTQGSGLSLVHGPWPYVTSTDTNAAQLCVDSGISPHRLTNTILVARTYPIRVAGNSGPLENETTFEDLGVEPETTTVTKKIRRVGQWDQHLFEKARVLNGPNPVIALTFADYVSPAVANSSDWTGVMSDDKLYEWVGKNIGEISRLEFVGTGPDSVAIPSWSKWA